MSRKVYSDAQLSQNVKAEFFRRQVLDGDGSMDEDEPVNVDCNPAVDDFTVLSGRPLGRIGGEILWDFEADPRQVMASPETEDPDEQLVEMFERGEKIIGRRI
jgi:hypothetical protein